MPFASSNTLKSLPLADDGNWTLLRCEGQNYSAAHLWHLAEKNANTCTPLGHVKPLVAERSVGFFAELLSVWLQDKIAAVLGPGSEFGSQGLECLGAGTLIATSGSIRPKWVLHALEQHLASAAGVNQRLGFGAHDAWLCCLPLYHVSGLAVFFRALLARATMVLCAPKALREHLQHHNITHLSLVPSQLPELLNDPAMVVALSQLKAILVGGGPMIAPLMTKAKDLGLPMFESYGSTEMASTWMIDGTCLSQRQARLVDGEIQVKGIPLFRGYVGDEGLELPQRCDGYFCTGDLGKEQEGAMVVAGRKDNMFISGGENIYPEKIERVLCQYPNVIEAIVVPLPHEKWGMRPAAFVRMHQEQVPDAAQISAFARLHLNAFEVPDHILPWPQVQSDGIKPSRKKLQSLASVELQVSLKRPMSSDACALM